MKVNLGEQLPLSGVSRALDELWRFIVVVASVGRYWVTLLDWGLQALCFLSVSTLPVDLMLR